MFVSKSAYEAQLVQLFAFNNSYKIFKYIKNITKSQSLPITMHYGNKAATSNQDKADVFN